jgi:beta-carotene 3-hydroxylase
MGDWLVNGAAFFVGLAGMEGVAWATHRYVMHGPLWAWHRSHHEPRRGAVELNDLFGLVFAGLAILAFVLGDRWNLPALAWLGAGMTAYGLLYALVHDGLVHRRFPFPLKGRRGYLLRIVQAHHLHHATHERRGAVSFGFLCVDRPERLAARLKTARGL